MTATVELAPVDKSSAVEAAAATRGTAARSSAGGTSLPATGGAGVVPLALVLALSGLLLRRLV
jgi:hypothetical protein